ncbi:serine/threonine protein kinase, variant [Aphanomyces astaci]|nr:serine/threonine protein kinase, variant [Aphanomyces astaci]ETV70249.1 serine/threonine protein kinase, variant [Aphanomyces astaci]|eukprot:XP_009840344.1 serine/threonine protein kinase, variant [Aphanomyces astaci]
MQLVQRISHPNLLRYVGLTVSDGHRLHVVSEHVAGGTLQRLLTDFGPLHRAIVPQYIHGLLCGLHQLHTHDVPHGDLSSARIFLGQHGRLIIGCYFPTMATMDALHHHRVLQGLATTTRVVSSTSSNTTSSSTNVMAEAMARDFRGVLWLMTEMLVGGRVRGIDIDPPRLCQLIADYPLEQSFLAHVLQLVPDLCRMPVDSAYEIVLNHPYLDAQVTWPQLVLQETPQQARATKAALELEHCVGVRAELSIAIDSWLGGFETAHGRPPKKKEWPPDIVELHTRLSALKVHMQDLHDAATHDKASIFGHNRHLPSQGAVVEAQRSTSGGGDTQRQTRRSTAQESFLLQASTSHHVATSHVS